MGNVFLGVGLGLISVVVMVVRREDMVGKDDLEYNWTWVALCNDMSLCQRKVY